MSAQFEAFPEERRRSPRINGAGITVEYTVAGAKAPATKAGVKNICVHGICVYMPQVKEVAVTYDMTIFLPGHPAPLHTLGNFVWYGPSDRPNCFNVGIEFEKMSESDQKKLAEYINVRVED